MTKLDNELLDELDGFKHIWEGGFRTGYRPKRNQKQIEEYLQSILKPNHTVFEIGCGGGQWTRFMSPFVDNVICNDAKDAQSNHFFEYLNEHKQINNVTFYHAKNFNLDYLDDESLDIVFSYDVFCHISYSGQQEYLKNLYTKCKNGCLLIIMYADPHKYINSEPEHIPIMFNKYWDTDPNIMIQNSLDDCDGKNEIGRWYYVGIRNFTEACVKYGYTILNKDLDIDKTNPITLFKR